MVVQISECQRCGNCCEQGGPALHTPDLPLIHDGKIPMSSLITIRQGELVNNPITKSVQAAAVELVKLIGTGRNWNCCYYDEQVGCGIYENRPRACRVLKCWDSEELLSIIEKDTLDRFAILAEDDPLLPVIIEHERICSCENLEKIQSGYDTLSDKEKAEIEKQVRLDLRFRQRVIKDFNLKLSDELFYFGRPYFQLLQPLGARVYESNNEIYLKW